MQAYGQNAVPVHLPNFFEVPRLIRKLSAMLASLAMYGFANVVSAQA